ncbi:MAG: CBS and ACT domain-containing protein [Clostridia bacterium]|nr:CBS and ACT domain-containing protein [Clostridia bacterium]
MLVKSVMSTPVISIPPKYDVGKALEVMRANHIKYLPIVSNNSIMGLVSESDLLKVFPKKTLNSFEMNLLSRTPIIQVMVKNPTIIDPDETLEKAAMIMHSCHIGCLPVVENNELLGMLTESDVINTFVGVMGIGQKGIRVTLKIQPRMGFLADLIKSFDELGIVVDKFVAFKSEIVVKVKTDDAESLRKELEGQGYEILHLAEENTVLACELPVVEEKVGS